jgi:hypothetical protein
MSEYEIAKFDLENVKRLTAKFPSNIPTEVQRIPTVEEEDKWLKLTLYNALYYVLTYGGDLLTLVSPWAGKAWNALIKWKFNWTPQTIPFDLKDLKK